MSEAARAIGIFGIAGLIMLPLCIPVLWVKLDRIERAIKKLQEKEDV